MSPHKWIIAAAITLLPCLPANAEATSPPAKTRVACIGNSITYGMTLPDREHTSYPSRLQQSLGEGYEVGNFGRNGATLLRKGHNPYCKTAEFAHALEFAPDIAVIHLGTNDTDPRNWPDHGDAFVRDYLWLTDTLRAVNPDMRIIVANMAPIGTAHRRFRSGTREWRDRIRELIPHVAHAAGAELIDFRTSLVDRQNLIPDNLHPNPEGAALLAAYVHSAITGDYGGLSLPEVYSDGMVLPHGKYLTIRGKADAGRHVTVGINNRRYTATSGNTGDWTAEIEPLDAGGPYELTVSDGERTLRIKDVMAGEVWLASGQSNMEFRLIEAADSPTEICPDSLLRVFHLADRRRPLPGQTDSVSQRCIDSLDYYKDAVWTLPSAEFSAVAWHFGRMLADSLRMPVGIIANAVGGAGTESFVDIETLQHHIPEILTDWQGNDYVQPWVQQRAIENMGGRNNSHRHPYEPSYLFAAGIRPLGGYPLSGVIWYQGESNAHNIEVHERLFPLLVESWRREFSSPRLPFITTQLSSINRPSWPEFRDSQRRLADSMTGVYMAVSSDLGDPTDVHPRRKAPVGRRLGRQALHHVYGMTHVTAGGPMPSKAEKWPDGTIRIIMTDARGMTTSDGAPARTFEIAETPGLFYPAVASISNDTIILSHPQMKEPRFARYGWQPFTTANVINSDSLPASTFSIEAVETEPGLERGVSAAFGGTVDGVTVIAGGCNFPYPDPLANGISKVYYKGIYRATDGTRIGSLPVATAYGASAATPAGLVMAGGEGLRNAWLLTLDADGIAVLTDLPELPFTLDNAYACAIGNTVYVGGGNADGVPSRSLLSLDVSNPSEGWQRHADMPGNPRVQPVLASSGGKIYVFGGFAPRHNGHEPTLECGGLCYDPQTGSWSEIQAPKHGRTPVTLSGGVAVTMADGKIICTGGVNKDVFLAAIRKQPADYLHHPAEWYRFNGRVCIFNPDDGKWHVGEQNPDYARAGAACAMMPDGTPLLMGGELKPRIRTPHFTPIEL